MQQNFDFNKITFLVGNPNTLQGISNVPAKQMFDETMIDFLNELSKILMSFDESKQYPDIITLGFWLRKASIKQLKEQFGNDAQGMCLGRGIAFHIAPSNVPVNFAYSLACGLLTGNANIVRVPSKEFPQVDIIAKAIEIAADRFKDIKQYIYLVRYERNSEINDFFSTICDVRIIWGGDNTIADIRKSSLQPRSVEVAFADRYSIAVIDSDCYMNDENKERIAERFYNDTYLTDQNACTSPRIVIWTGEQKEQAKRLFWNQLHSLVKRKYQLQAIQAINKLTSAYLLAANMPNIRVIREEDNLLTRVQVQELNGSLMEWKDNSGYFLEYDCEDILELIPLCDDKRCQTIGYLGEKEKFYPLLMSGVKGVDRVVPVGMTMDFNLIWDGYDLTRQLTRIISVI